MHTKAKLVDGLPIGCVANAQGQCVVDLRGARIVDRKRFDRCLVEGIDSQCERCDRPFEFNLRIGRIEPFREMLLCK